MTHDPREALEIVQQMIRGKPMSAWITDTRTMKSLGDVVQEALTASPGEHEPPPTAGWDIEVVADAIDLARYQPPSNPARTRPRPFSEADRSDREYATRLAKAALKALRSEAPAPEGVAGNEWHDGIPPKPWCNEWFIAATTFNDRVVLTALPEEYSYDFKTADDTYIKADKIKRWMQFPDSQFIPPSRPDAGGGVRGEWFTLHQDGVVYRKELTGPNTARYVVVCSGCSIEDAEFIVKARTALSNPPAAVDSNASVEAAHLFCEKDFIGAGGQSLSWKIECDVLSDADLKTIAAVCAPSLPKFCEAVGVPRGGLRLAAAMNAYADPAAKRVLIVDDVWTTGKSMTAIGASYAEWIGFVAFARGPLPSHVSSFMSISSASVEARLREALKLLISDIEDYERVNNLAPSPGKNNCWQSVTRAKEALSAVGDEAKKSEGGKKETFMTEDQIKYMVNRFLGWKLPANFNPDNGVSFNPIAGEGGPHPFRREPSGTNLLDAIQADAMVRYMIDRMPTPSEPTADRREIVARVLDRWKRSKNLHESLAAQSIEKELLAALDGGAGA